MLLGKSEKLRSVSACESVSVYIIMQIICIIYTIVSIAVIYIYLSVRQKTFLPVVVCVSNHIIKEKY